MSIKERFTTLLSNLKRKDNSEEGLPSKPLSTPEEETFTGNYVPLKQSDKITRNWFIDRYENVRTQRNILMFTLIIGLLVISLLAFYNYQNQTQKAPRPYVIEIEAKTGVPTVVDPSTSKAYTADEAVHRYFVWKYISLRESYHSSTYQLNYRSIRVLSTDPVFYEYTRSYGQGNPEAIINKAPTATRSVSLKSMIFQGNDKVQVRFRVTTTYQSGEASAVDKVVWMTFAFKNLELNDQQRMINPLGFQVDTYNIDEERI